MIIVEFFKGFGIENLDAGVIAAGAVLHYLKEAHHNKIPHITVATDGTTPPKYSNELLQLKTLPLSEAISIPATVGWWNGKEAVYTAP